MSKDKPLTFVLGGGKGTRLFPLTRDRAKPAVPFGGTYRVIDFVLSNLYHSDIRKIFILTQYESISLHNHLDNGWSRKFGAGSEEFLRVLPATLRDNSGWYLGTADAIAQNLKRLESERPNLVDIFGADHIYLMDVSQMNEFHQDNKADFTISALPIKRKDAAGKFGVLVVDGDWQLQGFEEKPREPTAMPSNEEYCLVSMGNYASRPDVLIKELIRDANKETTNDRVAIASNPEHFSSHDFGYDVIPSMLKGGKRIFVYDFSNQSIPGTSKKERGFWRDIGDLDQFYRANMEARKKNPPLSLYNPEWEVLTYVESPQPAKFINEGNALESIVANGVVCSGHVKKSILGYMVEVKENAQINDSVLLGHTKVGRNVVIKKAIVDRGVIIPDGETIGVDREKDMERGFTISEKGIVVVPRNYGF